MTVITSTNFNFPNQRNIYNGKVRDVYNINDEFLTMIVTDRISAFDVVLPKGIPFKGQVLNQLAKKFLKSTEDIVPNWMISSPDPNVTIGHFCKPFKIEMVIRGYLTGHAWRTYKSGKREICGVKMPDGMVEHQKFPSPIITPSTKADFGHDEDISREDILRKGIVESLAPRKTHNVDKVYQITPNANACGVTKESEQLNSYENRLDRELLSSLKENPFNIGVNSI